MRTGILYCGFRWQVHDETSGYQHVVPEGCDYVDGGNLFGGKAPFRSIRNRINLVLTDLVTCIRGLFYKKVFMFHPEHTVYFSPALLHVAGVKVIYAVHMDDAYWFGPTSNLIMRLKRWQMQFVSHFVLMSRVQMRPFEARFKERISFIPHGVWCSRVRRPLLQNNASTRFLVIGNSYRDYELLKQVCMHFLTACPEVTFHFVGLDRAKLTSLALMPNVTVHPRLASDDYYRLMASCELIFLPLTYASANNALLQGLAMGIPVICNSVEGVVDYLPDRGYLASTPQELEIFYRKRLTTSKAERSAEAAALCDYTRRNFDWKIIHERVNALCNSL